MSVGPLAAVAVSDGERLARFVLTERYVSKKDGKVKPEALRPYPWAELSVSRHRDLTVDELWQLGRGVAEERSKKEGRAFPLIGRADFSACAARDQNLEAIPDEPPLNHANVIDWPAEKSAQMSLAQEIVARSDFIRHEPAAT